MSRLPRSAALVGAVLIGALLAGCGDDEGSADAIAPADTTADGPAADTGSVATEIPASGIPATTAAVSAPDGLPVEVTGADGEVVEVTDVARIVPLNGELAEIVFALGLGDHVVATDISATYPPEAEALPKIGYQRTLVPEPILAFEPTLVLATPDAGPAETIEQLRGAGVDVVVVAAEPTLDGAVAKVEAVAAALGVPSRGAELAASMRADIDSARALAARATDHPRVAGLYLRGEAVQLVFGAGSGIDALLDAAAAVDVAAELGLGETTQLTAESLLVADPDVLVVTESGLESVGGVDGLLGLAGIGETTAGRERRVLAFEDQELLGMGPRVGATLLRLVRELHPDLS
jgi:iron complex transport system substrate-binding protein